jgi:hypothetical protein
MDQYHILSAAGLGLLMIFFGSANITMIIGGAILCTCIICSTVLIIKDKL